MFNPESLKKRKKLHTNQIAKAKNREVFEYLPH